MNNKLIELVLKSSMVLEHRDARHWRVVGDLGGREGGHDGAVLLLLLLLCRVGQQLVAAVLVLLDAVLVALGVVRVSSISA